MKSSSWLTGLEIYTFSLLHFCDYYYFITFTWNKWKLCQELYPLPSNIKKLLFNSKLPSFNFSSIALVNFSSILFSDLLSDQIRSVAQSCPTLCDPMNCSTPGLPVHHQLPEFTQTHFHRVSDAIQPSHPLSSPCPLAPNPSVIIIIILITGIYLSLQFKKLHQITQFLCLFSFDSCIWNFPSWFSIYCEWVKSLSSVWLFATPWTVAYWAPLSMGFSRQKQWIGLPFPSPGDLSDPGIELISPASPA